MDETANAKYILEFIEQDLHVQGQCIGLTTQVSERTEPH